MVSSIRTPMTSFITTLAFTQPNDFKLGTLAPIKRLARSSPGPLPHPLLPTSRSRPL